MKNIIINVSPIEKSYRKFFCSLVIVERSNCYIAAIEAFVKTMVSGLISEDITPVVDAYTHALTAVFPRARYVVGKDAKYLWLTLQALPEFLGDFFIELLATMNGVKPIPAACKN